MRITDSFQTTAGLTHTVQVSGAEADIIAATADLFPWITRPAKDCVRFRTFRTGGFQFYRITAADLAAVQAVLDAHRPRLTLVPTFTGGRFTFDTTDAADRTDAVQVALFATDTVDQPSLFGAL
jgi:hypothetical protein